MFHLKVVFDLIMFFDLCRVLIIIFLIVHCFKRAPGPQGIEIDSLKMSRVFILKRAKIIFNCEHLGLRGEKICTVLNI